MKSKLYGDKIDYNNLNNFIKAVWNYYNGRINVIIPARLNVSYVCGEDVNNPIAGKVAGRRRYPNTVDLYPNIIIDIRKANENIVMQEIIETIIHELHHIDQFILDSQSYNEDYVNNIEWQVEFQTISYILNNINDIYYNFGVVMDTKFYGNRLISVTQNYQQYERASEIDHIILGIDSMLMDNELAYPIMKTMTETYNDTNKDINYIINGTIIPIRKNGVLIDIRSYTNSLNTLWGNTFYKEVNNDNLCYTDLTDNELNVYLNYINGYNPLCRTTRF